jgi:rhodanese-related sulfurtransferase
VQSRPVPEIDIDEFAVAREHGAVVDVREPVEYAAGHVPGATLVPMSQVASRLGELEHALDKDQPVFVICGHGQRSLPVTDFLRHHGYDARSVAGGTAAWIRSGRAFDRGLEGG